MGCNLIFGDRYHSRGAKRMSVVSAIVGFSEKPALMVMFDRIKVMFDRIKSPNWVPVPLRLIVGCGFIEHGYAKLLKGPEAFALILHGLGVPAPHLMAWLTILTELLGGFAVLAGAFLPLVSVPMAVVLLVAMFSVHWQFGFSSIKLVAVTAEGPQFGPPGYETNLLYLACLVALVLSGSGPLSLDGWFARKR
jgi:putative oxidoreductase